MPRKPSKMSSAKSTELPPSSPGATPTSTGAESTSGTHGTEHIQHTDLTKIITGNSDLMTSIGKAIASQIANQLMAFPNIMDAIVDEICKSEKIVEAVASHLKQRITQEVYETTNFETETIKSNATAMEVNQGKLMKRIDQLEHVIDEQEQYSRRNCLLVHGLPESDNEDTDKLVINLFVDKLQAQINTDDLDRTHRLGRKQQGAANDTVRRPRPIIVKFLSYAKRNNIFRTKRHLKNSGYTITENLTMKRMKLLTAAKNTPTVKSAWTIDGRIHCLLNNDKRVTILNFNDLDNL